MVVNFIFGFAVKIPDNIHVECSMSTSKNHLNVKFMQTQCCGTVNSIFAITDFAICIRTWYMGSGMPPLPDTPVAQPVHP